LPCLGNRAGAEKNPNINQGPGGRKKREIMSKQMTRSELINTIADIRNGLAVNPTGEVLERLTSRLDRALELLKAMDNQEGQKKSDLQSPEKPEPPAQSQGHGNQGQKREQSQKPAQVIPAQSVTANVTAPAYVPEPVVEYTWVSGRVEFLTYAQALTEARAYFKTVYNSKAEMNKDSLYAYDTFRDLLGLLLVVKALGKPMPELADLHRGFGRLGEMQKARSSELYGLLW
jgi:hypothetical protein